MPWQRVGGRVSMGETGVFSLCSHQFPASQECLAFHCNVLVLLWRFIMRMDDIIIEVIHFL